MVLRRKIGTLEKVGFPEFNAHNITAKIDTGAYTGALHCAAIEERNVEGGESLVFRPLDSSEFIQKDEFIVKYVKSSNGIRQKRYFISTDIFIHGQKFEITLS